MRKILIWFAIPLLLTSWSICQDVPTQTLASPQFCVGWDNTPGQAGSYKYLTDVKFTGNSFASGKLILFKLRTSDDKPSIVDLVWSDGRRETNVSESKAAPSSNVSTSVTIEPCSSCGSQSLKTGAILFSVPISWNTGSSNYEMDANIEVIFRRLDWKGNEVAAVGVQISPFISKFKIQAALTSRTDTGFAVYNPNDSPIRLTMKLFNAFRKNGDPSSPVATAYLDLKTREQKALFFSEVFKGVGTDSFGNLATDGHVETTVDLPIAVTALKTYSPPNGSFLFASVPVLPIK